MTYAFTSEGLSISLSIIDSALLADDLSTNSHTLSIVSLSPALGMRSSFSDMNPPMLSVPGIGIESAAVILAEFGDFSKFKNASQMLSFAGLEPGYFQSGTSETTGKMVKHGSSYLRYALMNCAQTVVNYEPTFAMFYSKKRAEGKPHRVALSHVVKKLLRVIYTLQTKNIAYDADFVR